MLSKKQIRRYNRVVKVLGVLRRMIAWIELRIDRAEWAWSYCEECGENRFYGRPCRKVLGPTASEGNREARAYRESFE